MKTRTIILTALIVRVCIALGTQTFFQPDEYFQSLEVAHHLVFGYGHLTWEWLSDSPIRSILYPALNVPVYYAMKWAQLDGTRLLIWGPKVLHGVFASLTDIFLCFLTRKVLGDRYVSVTFFLSLTSLFHGMSLSRSMSNSLETSLTTVALSYFPWETHSPSWRSAFRTSMSIAALACAIRTTNAVLWIYGVALLVWRCRSDVKIFLVAITDLICIGILAIGSICGFDTLYYGRFTFTPFNFVLTNLSSVSLFYGSSPWHYYLTQGLPILCTTALPFAAHGIWLSIGPQGTPASGHLVGLLLWSIGIYSLAGHKEWRFLHPLLPLLHLFAAKSLVDLYHRAIAYRTPRGQNKRVPMLPVKTLHFCLLLLNIPALVYLMIFHSRAQIDVIHYFRSFPEDDVHSVGFLMPCHSTPWQAYLHKPTWSDSQRFWALGCEPPLGGEAIQDYRDQTDIFYESPITYLQDRFPTHVDPHFPPSSNPYTKPSQAHQRSMHDWQHQWPQYVVMFGALLQESGVGNLLEDLGYKTIWKEEYDWEGDNRRRGGIVVLKVA